jgi:hypothetical protein
VVEITNNTAQNNAELTMSDLPCLATYTCNDNMFFLTRTSSLDLKFTSTSLGKNGTSLSREAKQLKEFTRLPGAEVTIKNFEHV